MLGPVPKIATPTATTVMSIKPASIARAQDSSAMRFDPYWAHFRMNGPTRSSPVAVDRVVRRTAAIGV
jgi:hypothetical protein